MIGKLVYMLTHLTFPRLNRLSQEHPNRMSVGTLGLTARGNAIFYARVSAGARYPIRAVGEPMVRIMGTFMGDEPVGRQLSVGPLGPPDR